MFWRRFQRFGTTTGGSRKEIRFEWRVSDLICLKDDLIGHLFLLQVTKQKLYFKKIRLNNKTFAIFIKVYNENRETYKEEILMEERRNAHQNWLFFTVFLGLSIAIRFNREIVCEVFDAWINPYTIPIVAIVLIFLIRGGIVLGDWIAAGLRKCHIPAWLLFAITIVVFFWWGDQIG